jgi:hypothetical protein
VGNHPGHPSPAHATQEKESRTIQPTPSLASLRQSKRHRDVGERKNDDRNKAIRGQGLPETQKTRPPPKKSEEVIEARELIKAAVIKKGK